MTERKGRLCRGCGRLVGLLYRRFDRQWRCYRCIRAIEPVEASWT